MTIIPFPHSKTPRLCSQIHPVSLPLRQQLLTRPILIVSIGQVPPNHQRDLLLLQLLCRNLQRIRHALDINQDRRISTDLQRTRAQDPRALVLCHVRRRRALVVGYLPVLLGRNRVLGFALGL